MSEHFDSSNPQWERQALQNVLLEHLKEQRRSRRWGIFFKILILAILAWIFFNFSHKELSQPVVMTNPHSALIDIYGEILPDEPANADAIRDALKAAFENKQVKGLILRINSPGGSPVQAHQIFAEIRALRAQYPNTKVYAAIEDLGTSAAYLIASAADAIYADKSSLVGSIGVKIDSFGFVDVMHKVGVERRLYVSGKYKGILDPFSPRNIEEEQFINEQLRLVHEAFIHDVREGRGARLKESPEIFSGLFWNGEQALTLGLIDGYGDAQFIAKEIIKAEAVMDYTPGVNFLDRLARRVGASMGQAVSSRMGLVPVGAR